MLMKPQVITKKNDDVNLTKLIENDFQEIIKGKQAKL